MMNKVFGNVIAFMVLALFLTQGVAFKTVSSNENVYPVDFHGTPNVTAVGNATAQVPYFHNVFAGNVWVFPSISASIETRDTIACECFDPAGELAMLSHTCFAA